MKISLSGKEYESGEITREKYRKFAAVYESLLGKEQTAQTFSDEDLDNMVEAIVLVFGNQFTFDEADEGLDEISSIILNFSLINAEIMNKTNLQAEAVAKTLKTNVITIGGKEYESGKIGRKKYRAFREVYNDLVKPEKQTYTDEELDRMVTAIVEIYDNQFSFEQQSENNIVLVGMLLESIYQFDNEKGSLRDAWNNCWNNIEKKDGDQRSFYYFAFNCFDREIDHYFTPDKITRITIDYTINQYTFFGQKSEYKQANLAKKEQKIQIVTPDTIHVETQNNNSNHHPYEYNTIYKLSEAEIKDYEKSANYNTLYTAQQAGFEWVVHFGSTDGYRYSENFTRSLCDIDYTKVENFSTINMTYTYKGEEYSVPTDTLVDMEVLTKREKDRTEKLSKQIKNSINFAVESLGNLFADTAVSVLSLPFRFIKGVLKNIVVRIIVIIIAILLISFIILIIKNRKNIANAASVVASLAHLNEDDEDLDEDLLEEEDKK